MDREVDLDSIRALEEQIEEHEKAIIQLKRTRNSLLNVSTLLSPEILGRIFHWNVVPGGDFDRPPEGSYNFLLVCHHWFEVASRTPELWCSWGNSIRDWTHRYPHHGTAPLDLTLAWYTDRSESVLDDRLHDALQDRAARDTIRRIHLRSSNTKLLNSIISSIVTKDEPRSSSVESLVLQNSGHSTVEVSDFFARHCFPELKCLCLSGCGVSSWDLLKSKTMTLTTLDLAPSELSPIPTVSQLCSILSSNPLLQNLVLSDGSAPHVVDVDRSSPRVPLHHLKAFRLSSDFCHAFGLLNQLELPDKMDKLRLSLYGCSPLDLPQILGPYIGDRIRRRGKFPGGGLGLSVEHRPNILYLSTEDVHKSSDSTGAVRFMTVEVVMSRNLEEGEEKIGFDFIAHIPLEEVVNLRTTLPILRSEELCVEMCNLARLSLFDADVSTVFVEPEIRGSHTSKDLLPSLDFISITRSILSGGDWGPFTGFLARRATVGNRIYSLKIDGLPHMDTDVIERISRVVEVFGHVDR